MIRKHDVLKRMHEGYAVAVVRGKSKDDAVEIAKHAFKGGIVSQEITFTTRRLNLRFQSLHKQILKV